MIQENALGLHQTSYNYRDLMKHIMSNQLFIPINCCRSALSMSGSFRR